MGRPIPACGPEESYERQGLAPNVVFSCGAVACGDELWMYYGAADCSIGLAMARVPDLLVAVLQDRVTEAAAIPFGTSASATTETDGSESK